MSYIVPSVLIYQQLATNAGVANITPDLSSVIVGPLYNVVSYDPTTTSSLSTSAAVTTSGGSTAASLTNNAVNNVVYIGSTKVGQVIDPSTVNVYFNNAYIQTKVCYMTGTASTNSLTFAAYSGTGSAALNATSITGVTNVAQLNAYDKVTLAGAGPSGGNLTTTILSINGTTLTISDTVSTAVTNAAITRTSFNNLNSVTSTLNVQNGDVVVITYGSTTFVTSVLGVTGTNNVITGITTVDILPVGITVPFTVSIRQEFNNLLLAPSLGSHVNYTTTNIVTDGSVTINALPVVNYGTVVTGDIYITYKALRKDVLLTEIPDIDTQLGTLGVATDDNPLGLAVNLALANTTGSVFAMPVQSNDLSGYVSAFQHLENQRMYCFVALTQDIAILTALQQHIDQLSTPENASWRIGLVNTAIPITASVGIYNVNYVNANSGNNTVTLSSGNYYLNSSNATFINDGVIPGDIIKVTSSTPSGISSFTVLGVVSNQQVQINATTTYTGVSYYVERNLTKTQQASAIAAMSSTFADHRIIHVQPDLVGITVNGSVKYLPGYYLAAAMSGLVSGLPAQQSLTNIGIAGIEDLENSNRYFTRSQLNTISGSGTCLFVQEAANTIPYIRHSLTTDMTVLQYRELQQVKNIDYLSYFFYDILKGFPGRYNITTDTLQLVRATLVAGAKLLQGKVLPKIGPPLIDYQITSLQQDTVNKDTIIVNMPVTIPTVANYINLYLIY
jgi:hypothetical protein